MKEKRQLEVLYQISNALVGMQDLDAVLAQIVHMTAELAGSNTCSLMLLDDRGELAIKATQSLSLAYRQKAPVKAGKSVSGLALQKKKAIQVSDVTKEPAYAYPDIAKKEGLKSLLSVPLMVKGKAIGVLNCYTGQEKTFSEEEIQLVQTMANQAAIMIEHVRIVSEEAEARLALSTRKAVESAKRILMKKRKMSEEDAHRFIQKASMERNKPQKEIAEAILVASELDQ